jgi:tetratricopeptide (TPR) repeat protein
VRRRGSSAFWIGVTSWLLWMVQPVEAQGNGHSTSRPAPDTRAVTSRPASEIERAIGELRKAQNIAAAALSARAAYGIGEDARKVLLDLCREKSLPEVTLQGIVGAFEFERDRSVLAVLFELYGAGDTARDRYLTERFRAFDSQQSMFEEICWSLERVPSSSKRRAYFRVLAEIVDTPGERMQAARYLVQAFSRDEFRGYGEDLRGALQKITFHDYPLPAQWQKWLDGFAATHSEGFPEADLYASALRERDQRFVAEVKRAISVAIVNKQVPPDCFDQARYPEAGIRIHAAQEFAALKDADPAVVTSAARILADAFKSEHDEDVVCAVLRSLGVLAENREELKQEIGPKLVPFLKDDRDTVVVAALKAIALTGTGGTDCHVVEELYSETAMANKDRSAVRAQVVTTLYSLDCGSPTIVTALEDTSADVRMSAARGLGYTKRADAAPQIAKALATEKNDEAQRVMARALYALQSYPPEVVDALADVAGKPGIARDAAVRGLLHAISAGQLEGTRADRVVALLFEALPVLAASPDKRKVILDDLKTAKGDLTVKVLAKWLEVEAQPDLGRELATILVRLVPAGGDALPAHANALISAGRAPAAVVLLRAAIDQNGAASAPATRGPRNSELRIALARALLIERTSEGLNEAETIASQGLRANPDDGQLLLLRGSIREALGRRFEAAEDLRRALKAEGAAMADAQRLDAERKTAQLLLASDPKKAKEFLESLPAQARDREYLVILAQAELALGNARQAVAHLKAALAAPGRDDAGVARYFLIQALLKSPRGEDRLEAKKLFEALDAEPSLPEGHPLLPLREEVKAQGIAQAAVRDLDEATSEGATASLATVIALGKPALPWLVHRFAEVASTAPVAALERRLEALQAILASDLSAARTFAALSPPGADASRETWVAFSARLLDWWDRQ